MKNMGKKSIQEIEEAISKLLSNHLRARVSPIDNPPDMATQEPIAQQPATLPLTVLNLSSRTLNTLKRAKIKSVSQLASYSDQDLLYLRHFGSKSLKEVRHALSAITPDGLLQVTATEAENPLSRRTKKRPPSASKLWHVPPDLAGLSITVLALSKRSLRVLETSGVWTLGDLAQLGLRQLRQIKNLGQKSEQEIQQAISKFSPADLRAKEPHKQPEMAVRIPLVLTSLPAQIQERLNDQIKDVAQLCQLTKDELSQFGLSAGNITQIEEMLKSHSLQLANPDKRDKLLTVSLQDARASSLSPSERIERLLSKFKPRHAKILRWRHGLDGNEPLTLEEVGQRLGITRERVRQIEQKGIYSLQDPIPQSLIRPLILSLQQALEKAHGVLSAKDAHSALCANHEEELIHPEWLLEFVLQFTHGKIERVRKKPLIIALKRPNTYFDHILETWFIFERLLKEERAPLGLDKMLEQFAGDKEGRGQTIASQAPTEFLMACLEANPNIEINKDGEYALKQWAKKVLDDIIVVLRQHGKALHYSEIAKRVNKRVSEEQQTTSRNVHAKLGSYSDIFIRVGHGIFGLAKWGLTQDRTLADAAIRVLRETGHPLNLEQLTDGVLETWHARRTSVQMAVQLEPRLSILSGNLYWIADTPEQLFETTDNEGNDALPECDTAN